MTALHIPREEPRLLHLHHGDLFIQVEDEQVNFEDWIVDVEEKAEWRGFWQGAAWILIPAVTFGLAVGLHLWWHVFYNGVL